MKHLKNIFYDLIDIIFLLFYCILMAPVFLMYQFWMSIRLFFKLAPLVKEGILGTFIRSQIDFIFFAHSNSAEKLDSIVQKLENKLDQPSFELNESKKALFSYLYGKLALAYLLGGLMDKAAQVVIRAHNHIGSEKLPGIFDLDVKSAHIVKAGIAAGKLLEKGGYATVMVKTSDELESFNKPKTTKRKPIKSTKNESNIIPFPTR